MLDDVFHLGSDVKSDIRMLLLQCAGYRHRVSGAVQEIGIAERNMSRARLDLLPGVGKDNLTRDHEEAPVVYGGDGTVKTPVQATPARLHVSNEALFALRRAKQAGILVERGETITTRLQEREPTQNGLYQNWFAPLCSVH